MQIPARLVIATRESRLALWQARHVQSLLQTRFPGMAVDLLGMTTRGDRILDRPLKEVGGKGLFIKELEVAMQEGRADLAVHSLKDVPMEMPAGFELAAITRRENPRDALVSPRYSCLEQLPAGSIVGTSSLRRAAQLQARYPQLRIEPLRGNLDTRLQKLDAGQYDAIILAAAGLIRLGLGERISRELTPEESLPAPGQGALGIEIPSGRPELQAVLAALADAESSACVLAERAVSRALGGSCHLPLGAYAEIVAGELWLRAFVASADGRDWVAGELRGQPQAGESLGAELGRDLLARGGDRILATLAGA